MKEVHQRREENDYPYPCSSCSGTDFGYSVEARYNHYQPKRIGEQIFDARWQTIQYQRGMVGIPAGNALDWAANRLGLFSYQAAQALRWWFHAHLESEVLGDLCFETRLVEHKITYSYSCEAVAAHEHIGGDAGDRSTRKPTNESNG